MSNREKAMEDFGVVLEEKRVEQGMTGTVFFASLNDWNEVLLRQRTNYPAMVSDYPFHHREYGYGYAVFVFD